MRWADDISAFCVRESRSNTEGFSKLNISNTGKRHKYVNRSSRSK